MPVNTTQLPAPVRTCAELGVCQNLAIPCLLCTRADAERWPPEQDTLSSFEQISYWIGTTLVCTGTVGVLCGMAGYAYIRWVSP